MLLCIDVRNTSIELGLFSGSGEHAKLVRHWRMHTNPLFTADEFALQVRGLIGADADQVVGVAALSTVPPVLRELREMLSRYWAHVPHVLVEPGVRTGIPLLVDNPKEVGADRIVNCLAAYHRFQSPLPSWWISAPPSVWTWFRPRGNSWAAVSRRVWRFPPRR